MTDREIEYRRDRRTYLTGFVLAVILTAIAFAGVAWEVLSVSKTLWLVALCGLVQIVVHFRFFLHIDLSRQKREDLQLVLFTALILAIMCGGTIWIAVSLSARMM